MSTLPFAAQFGPALQVLKRLTQITLKEPKMTLGVDIGSTSIKVVALGTRKGAGARPLIGQHVTPLEAGQEVDASDTLKAAVGALSLPLRSVNLSVSGQWVIIRVVEMPTMKPAEMKQALPFEAQRYLPFPIQDVVIDGAALGSADANKMWVLIVACKKELLVRRIDWAKRAGFGVGLIDVDALALANSFLAQANGRSSSVTRALINVGAQMTNLVVFKGEVPYLVRDIPWGGEKLARGAADQLGAEVETVKKELLQGQASREVQEAIRLAAESLSSELQLSFDYFENRFGQPPEEILVSGGLSLCPPFLEALKSHVTQTVNPWAPIHGLSGQFAVAYGLALRAA